MNFALFLDLIVIALLVSTILYAVKLNKQLTTLYQSRGELQSFLQSFTGSLTKAELSMQALRSTGETTFTAVHEALTKAQALRDDLSYLVERGEAIASNLDESIRQGRQLQKEIEMQKHIQTPAYSATNSEEDPDLIRHLRNVR